MTSKKLMIAVTLCLALIISALPLVSACASKPAEAPTKGPLKIGISTPTTGPAAEKGSPMGHANLDAIEYVNNELDGIDGHPVEAMWLDNSYDASKIVTIANAFMDEGCLMYSTASSKMMASSMEIANRAGFPGLASFTSPILYRPPQHIYGQLPDYGDDWGAFASYYMKNVWKGSGKPKMALHLLNNPTGFGARDAAKASAEKMGIEIISINEHTATTISETESLNRIKAMNPDVLYISSTPAPTAIIIKNAYELGMYPGMTIGLGHASFTKALIDIAGADIVEGVHGVFPTVNWGDDVPGMAKVTEYVRKLHPKDEGNMDYITSWAQSLIMVEIVRTALKNTSYDVLAKGGPEAWEAIETQGIHKLNYDVGGLHGPAKYTPGDNRLSKSLRVFQIKGGAITPITDWIEAPLIKFEEFDWFGK